MFESPRTPTWVTMSVTLGIVFLAILGAILIFTGEDSPAPKTVAEETVPKTYWLESRMLVTGNSFWGRYVERAARRSENPEAFPFARLAEFGRQDYEAWITGLECPVTDKGSDLSPEYMNETLVFNCDPGFLPEFARWFDVVTLANNHTDNMGADGFIETQQKLESVGIQYFGHYDPEKTEDVCEVIGMPVRAFDDRGQMSSHVIPIAMCAHHGVYRIPSETSINQIQAYAQYFPVIAMPHSGTEYVPSADGIKTRTYRAMIDAGADVVLGDHPHWVQNSEAYKNKLIIYSMGNFIFDQQGSLEVIRSAAIDLTVRMDNLDSNEFEELTSLGTRCFEHKDSCLDYAQTNNMTKPKVSFEYEIVATNNRGYQVHPDSGLLGGVRQRLGWESTASKLN